MKKTLLIFTQFFIVSLFSFGQFVENKGQVLDFDENFRPEVKYYYSLANTDVYFENNRLVYHLKELEKVDENLQYTNRDEYDQEVSNRKVTYHRMDMYFENASNRSEEHTSELQSRPHLVCRLLL